MLQTRCCLGWIFHAKLPIKDAATETVQVIKIWHKRHKIMWEKAKKSGKGIDSLCYNAIHCLKWELSRKVKPSAYTFSPHTPMSTRTLLLKSS